jgi:hypothetical protein
VKAVEHRQEAFARDAEYVADALRDEAFDQQVAGKLGGKSGIRHASPVNER